MSLLVSVFTCKSNEPYFRACMEHIEKALDVVQMHNVTLVINFGNEPIENIKNDCYSHFYYHRPGAGFCQNFNFSLQHAAMIHGAAIFSCINDDAMIHSDFFREGIEFLRIREKAALVGGVPNQGWWGLSLDQLEIPEPHAISKEITDFRKLNWEFSALMAKTKILNIIGGMDEYFDPLGVLADNDLLMRLAQKGYKSYRNWNMPFFHCKGISQLKHGRVPIPGKDKERERALDYMQEKWGVDITLPFKIEDMYKEPFNK